MIHGLTLRPSRGFHDLACSIAPAVELADELTFRTLGAIMQKLACAALASVHTPMSAQIFATSNLGSQIFEAVPAALNRQTSTFDNGTHLIDFLNAQSTGPTGPANNETRTMTNTV